ncbi:MAG: methylaspartate mutase accessory protein GlmL, partial [Cetobacterium sp.]
MKCYLTIDFGSTYTKLTAIDIEAENILATAKDITTIENDIMIGFNNAFEELKINIEKVVPFSEVEFVNKIACSSAAGGLKMFAIGLVPELTAEAAKKAALGAGARVMKTFSYELNSKEMEEIKNAPVDIILLAGGTDGGNKECIIHNAKLIAKYNLSVPVIVSGNKAATDEIEEIFKEANIDYYMTENVMPKLNKLNVEPAREAIRQVFMHKIVEAKGMKNAEEFISGILMPTPAAVLKAAEVLSSGTDEEDGIGDLIIIDIGGATTDIHSIGKGDPTKPGVMIKGLEDPFSKRTVEGDLGMRYSAISLLEAAGTKKLRAYLGDTEKLWDVKADCNYRHDNIKMVPSTEREIKFDEAMAMAATEIAMSRH